MTKVVFEYPTARKKRRFKNSLMWVDGVRFQSKLEGTDYLALLEKVRRGQIRNLRRQVPFEIALYILPPDGKLTLAAKLKYVADFTFEVPGEERPYVYESKGMRTKEFRLKWKLLPKLYPNWRFLITPTKRSRR